MVECDLRGVGAEIECVWSRRKNDVWGCVRVDVYHNIERDGNETLVGGC